MKNKKFFLNFSGRFLLLTLLGFMVFNACKENSSNQLRPIVPPDPNIETKFTTYYPDSGGVASKLIVYGSNFGTDTSYIKVTVNDKNAKVIASDGEAIYAIVPSRAGTGEVKVFIVKGDHIKEFAYDNEFRYTFRENVTTVCGQVKIPGTVDDADGEAAKLQRPWHVITDKDGILYFIDEGRGADKNGGLRKVVNGKVETIMRNQGIFKSPTGLAFNLTNDTLFMVQALWNDNAMIVGDPVIVAFTRDEAFQVAKKYVNTGTYNEAFAIAVHPVTGELFYGSRIDGFIYRVDKSTSPAGYEKCVSVVGNGTEMRFAFSPNGEYLYVINKNKHNVYRVKYNFGMSDPTKVFDTPELFAGSGTAGYQDGIGVAAQFWEPSQGACDNDGNLYVADKKNHCIRMITPSGHVTTFAGKGETAGYADGSPLEAMFDSPECVTYSQFDDCWYVADRENHLIRKILVE